jgi:hypothetical protein
MAGRPEKQFSEKDIEQIKVLARCHCPDSEIAAWFECGERTIQRHFGALLKECREAGKANIRAKQYRLAMDGDRTMLIWLGKQLLGQREQTHISLEKLPDAMIIEETQRRINAKNNDA